MKSENQFNLKSKDDLRKKALNNRKTIKDKFIKDKKILDILTDSSFYKEAETILCYVSLDSEIDTKELIKKALSENKTVAVPLCKDDKGNMDFYRISTLNDLKKGYMGISEPDKDTCELLNDYSSCIAVVPGLYFTKTGKRLGYGGGYYDKFLKNKSLISIGLCYNSFIINDLPTDINDVCVNYVVCESCIYGG